MKRTEIKKLLPSVMQRSITKHNQLYGTEGYESGSVLSAFIEVMEKMHKPTEDLMDNLHQVFNPRQVPEHFLPMLAHWTNLINLFQPDKAGSEPSLWKDRTLPTEPGYLRELIATSVEISQWRGTNYGLKKVLQIATGISDFSIQEIDKPFHIEVGVPKEAEKYWELIQRIVEQEKPAHITAEVFIVSDDDDRSAIDSYYEDDNDDQYDDDEDGDENQYYEDEDEGDDQYDDSDEDDDQYYDDEDEDDDQYYERRKPAVSRDSKREPAPKHRPSGRKKSDKSSSRPDPATRKKPGKPTTKSATGKKAAKPTANKKAGKLTSKPAKSKKPGKPVSKKKAGKPAKVKKPRR